MKLEGRILLFDMVNINNDIFPKTCKMDISEKIPLTWDFQHDKVIGFVNVIKDERGLIAKAETFSNEFITKRKIILERMVFFRSMYSPFQRKGECCF